MNFKNIGILDDSIGGLKVLESLKNIYNENYIYFADLKEYPYGMKRNSIENLSLNAVNTILEKNLKLLIVTNPAISYNIKNAGVKKIDGIERALKSLSDRKLLILGSKLSLDREIIGRYLREENYETREAQMLINMPHDGDDNYYIVSELVSEYIGDYRGDVLLLDSNLSVLEEYFKKYSSDIKVHTLNEYILEDAEEFLTDDLRHRKGNRTKVHYFTSDYRIAFYKSAEQFFDERFSSVRKIK